MSSLENARGNAATTRRATTASGAKSRVPSSRAEPGDLPLDSAIHGPHRNGSSSRRVNGLLDVQERRIEKTKITTKDSTAIRTKNPVKPVARTGLSHDPKSSESRTSIDKIDAWKRGEVNISLPWDPQAKLLSNTTAPLASLISHPPLSHLLPDRLQPVALRELSPDLQEPAIVEDLLFAFMGYEGQYIRFVEDYDPSIEKCRLVGPGFTITPGLDPSLRDLASTMLVLATHYCAVEAFADVESREDFGLINHALGSAIRKLLKEYLVLIAHLEHQFLIKNSFTLHVLHLEIIPTMNRMSQLYDFAQEMLQKHSILEEEKDDDLYDDFDVDNILESLREGGDLAPGGMSKKICKGGRTLRALTERLSSVSGDPEAKDLLRGLLKAASEPYVKMLNEWLHRGSIRDPHSEFLIKEQKSINRDHLEEDFTDMYWEKRYTTQSDIDIPPQLESVKAKVLLAGKYLNVVRECGGVDVSTEAQDVPKSFDDPNFLHNVNVAYAHANASLLKLLLTTHALPARLHSMKHYFFLDRADFFSYFLYLSDSELKKSARSVNIGKLQSLLDLVLRQPGSAAAEEPYKEDVKVSMNDQYLTKFLMSVVNVKGMEKGEEIDELKERLPAPSVTTSEDDSKMTGFEALEFKYSVPFPVSLVISSKTVIRYQMLFRYLLSLRHLEGLVVSSWEEHNKVMSWTHKSSDPRLEMWKRKAWSLRGRMLNYVQQSLYYCTSEVIDPNWRKLMAIVEDNNTLASRTVDELMNYHVDFLDTCLKEIFLTNSRLLKIHTKLVTCCTMYASWTATISKKLFSADATLAATPAALSYLATQYPPPTRPHGGIPDRLKSYDSEAVGVMNEMLAKYEANFNRHLTLLLEALDYFAATETPALGRLCACLSMASEKGLGERNGDGL